PPGPAPSFPPRRSSDLTDRIVIPHSDDEDLDATRTRVTDSVEQALRLGEGIVVLALLGEDGSVAEEQTFSEHFACSNTEHEPYRSEEHTSELQSRANLV